MSLTAQNYQRRLALESWYTNLEQEPLNRCQQLPVPYKRLMHYLKRNQHTSAKNRWIESNSKTTEQSLQLDDQSPQNKTDQKGNEDHDQRHKYHHRPKTLSSLDSEDDYMYRSGNRNVIVSHQQQSFSIRLLSPG